MAPARPDTFTRDGRALLRATLAFPPAPWVDALERRLYAAARKLSPDRLEAAVRDPEWRHALDRFTTPGPRQLDSLERAFGSAVRRAAKASILEPHRVVLRIARGCWPARTESLVREALDGLARNHPDAYARMVHWTSTIEVRPRRLAGWTAHGAPGLTFLGYPLFGEDRGRPACVFLTGATLVHEAAHHALNSTAVRLSRRGAPHLSGVPTFVLGKTAGHVLGELHALLQGAALIPRALRLRTAQRDTLLWHYDDLDERLTSVLECLTPEAARRDLLPAGKRLLAQLRSDLARLRIEVAAASASGSSP